MAAATSKSQKLLKISRFLFQSICGALFFTRLARTFSLASAAVGLRLSPLSSNGSLFSTSPSCVEEGRKDVSLWQHPSHRCGVLQPFTPHGPSRGISSSMHDKQTRRESGFSSEQKDKVPPPCRVCGFTGSSSIRVARELITTLSFGWVFFPSA